MIVRTRENGPDVVAENLDLIARDLGPARVVADDGDDTDPMSDERVEFDEAVSRGAVAEENPDLRVGVGATVMQAS